MMKNIDHVGVVVRNIEEALYAFSGILGFAATESIEDPKREFRSVAIAGDGVSIELLEPLNPGGAMAKFLEQRGGGLHHLAIEVDDIDAAMETCGKNGASLLSPEAVVVGNRRTAFIHPRSAAGVLIELVERKPS